MKVVGFGERDSEEAAMILVEESQSVKSVR